MLKYDKYTVYLNNGDIIDNCILFTTENAPIRLRLSRSGIKKHVITDKQIIVNTKISNDYELQDKSNDMPINTADIDSIRTDTITVFSRSLIELL